MKKLLTHNFGLKLLSLGIAIVFWIVIVNSEDPTVSRTFKDIPVTVLNEEQVTEKEKILEVIDGDTVDVVVEGRRSELDKLTEADIYATADLSEVSFMDTVLIKVAVPNYPDVTVRNNAENVMKLLFDDYVTRKYSFRVNTVGETMDGYYVGDALPSPNIIQISGAKTVLDKIREVALEVDVSGRSVDFTTTAVPVVYDMNGDVISSSKLTMQLESANVTVNVPVLASKDLEVRVKAVGEVPEGYEVLEENIAFQPETVRIAGTKEELQKLGKYLELEVDVTDQTGIIEKNFQISAELDNSLTSLKVVETQLIAVKITVTPYIDRNLEISKANIELRNLSEGLTAEVLSPQGVLVKLKCKAARAPYITADHLTPYVDLDGYTEGTYKVALRLELPAKVLWNEVKEVEVVVHKDSAVQPREVAEAAH